MTQKAQILKHDILGWLLENTDQYELFNLHLSIGFSMEITDIYATAEEDIAVWIGGPKLGKGFEAVLEKEEDLQKVLDFIKTNEKQLTEIQ